MNTKELGCLTPIALISAVIAIIVLVIVGVTGGNTMFSPGTLFQEHAESGGDCSLCHAPFWNAETMTDRCLRCHTEIKKQITEVSGLHGGAMGAVSSTCQACHTDHAGTHANITTMDLSNFAHDAFGFDLGKHTGHSLNGMGGQAIECEDCHAASYSDFDQNTCQACHTKINSDFMIEHSDSFAGNCLACHDGADRFSQFDHSATGFNIDGAHAQKACSDCHKKAVSLETLQISDSACANCHQQDDEHNGEFGANCAICHTTQAWEPANFDHSRANFALDGKHVEVECESCHVQGYTGTPSECSACHQKDDKHNGSFGASCHGCHNTSSWEDAVFDHSQSAFPLTGAHTNTSCEQCHQNGVFTGTPTECSACHTDPVYHLGMFPGQSCSLCHTTNAWQPGQYNLPHSFPMNHGEERGANTCASCHQPTLAQWTCYTCHSQSSVESEHREERITNFTNCLECHPTGQEGEGGGHGD